MFLVFCYSRITLPVVPFLGCWYTMTSIGQLVSILLIDYKLVILIFYIPIMVSITLRGFRQIRCIIVCGVHLRNDFHF